MRQCSRFFVNSPISKATLIPANRCSKNKYRGHCYRLLRMIYCSVCAPPNRWWAPRLNYRLLCKDSSIQREEKHLFAKTMIAHASSTCETHVFDISHSNQTTMRTIRNFFVSNQTPNPIGQDLFSLNRSKISAEHSVNLGSRKGVYGQQFLDFIAMSLFLGPIFYFE